MSTKEAEPFVKFSTVLGRLRVNPLLWREETTAACPGFLSEGVKLSQAEVNHRSSQAEHCKRDVPALLCFPCLLQVGKSRHVSSTEGREKR